MNKKDIYAIVAIEVGVWLLPFVLEVVIAVRFTIITILLLIAVVETLRWVFLAGVMEGEMRGRDRIRVLEKENSILRRKLVYEEMSPIREDRGDASRTIGTCLRREGKNSQRENYDIEAQRE